MKFILAARFLIFAALLLASFLGPASEAQADFYRVDPCGGDYQACTIVRTVRTPTPDQVAGLNSALFLQYFEPILRGQTGTFRWSISDSSKDGYVIGYVNGPNSITVQYIFRGGQLLCCFIDSPYFISDINDSNAIVGDNIYTIGAFVGDADNAAAGQNYVPGEFLPQGYPDGIQIGYRWRFEAIDEYGNILARCSPPVCAGTQYYEIRVPEPASFFVMLGVAGILLRKRIRPIFRKFNERPLIGARRFTLKLAVEKT